MINKEFLNIGKVAALFGALSAQAHANSCGDVSPLKQMLGDEYALMTYSAEHDAQQTHLNEGDLIALIDSASFRSGKGVRHQCMGTGNAEREVITEFTLDNIHRIETARGLIQLDAWEESTARKASAGMTLPAAAQWTQSAENTYTNWQVFRRATNNAESDLPQFEFPFHTTPLFSGSQQAELARSIHSTHEIITLKETLYVNGYKTHWVVWELDR